MKWIVEEVLRYIGVPKGKIKDDVLEQEILTVYQSLQGQIKPRSVWKKFKISCSVDEVVFEGTNLRVKSEQLTNLLKNCEYCYVLAASLGITIDQEIARLQKCDMNKALIANACGIVLIEKVCDELETSWVQEMEDKQYLTMRYSPGYGDVSVEIQEQLLGILNAQKAIGLTTTKSQMLIPSKSITAFVGISNTKENRQRSCRTCHLQAQCIYRRRGEKCGS
ncbi:MAG: vitamin B12 dependent-methionine synthase activation domain-containing protein [Cellulosilyticaceae bacterium]